jgi:hypothetical protein
MAHRAPANWIALPDGSEVLFGIGMVRPAHLGLFEAIVEERSIGFFRDVEGAKRALERQARQIGLLPPLPEL